MKSRVWIYDRNQIFKTTDPGVHGAIIFNPQWAKETAYLMK